MDNYVIKFVTKRDRAHRCRSDSGVGIHTMAYGFIVALLNVVMEPAAS